jgi:PAS domain S-box-containing protein
MNKDILSLIDFEKVDSLLEGFNKTTGFVTAILDLEGNILSKSGWRKICTDFHRVNPYTSRKCTLSDTELAGELIEGEKYHFYKCLNGLIDVVMPITINSEHIANLYSGQFFFEEPDKSFFKNQAKKYGFDEQEYLATLKEVPIVSKEKVKTAMFFLLNITKIISEMTFQKMEQKHLIKSIRESEEKYRFLVDNSYDLIWKMKSNGVFSYVSPSYELILGYKSEYLIDKAFQLFLHPEDITLCDNFINCVLEAKKPLSSPQYRVKDSKGSWRWHEASMTPVYTEDGLFMYFVGVSRDITERKQAEKNLNESELRFHQMLSMIPDMISIQDRDMNILYSNWNGFGAIPEEKRNLKTKCYKTYRGYDEICPDCLAKTVFETRKPFNSEILLSNNMWIDLRVIPILDKLGEVEFFVELVRDITESKQANDKLRKSKQIMAQAEELAALGSWEWDIKNDTWLLSDIWKIIHGVSDTNLSSNQLLSIAHPDDRSDIKKAINKSVEKGEPYEIRHRIIQQDTGEIRQVLAKGILVFDNEGKPTAMIGASQDITEQKKLELRNQTLVNIIEQSQDFIGIADEGQKAFFVNPAGQSMLGLDNDEIVRSTNILEYFLDEDLPFVKNTILPTLFSKGRWSGEFSLRNFKTGEPVPVLYDLFLTEDPETGELKNITTISRDISERKKYEEELLKKNNKLEKQHQNFIKLYEELSKINFELETARIKAEESDKLKTAFINNISHEIRTPLNGILGFGQIIAESELSKKEKRECFSHIENSSNRLLNTVNDYMDMAMLYSKTIKAYEEEFVLGPFISVISEKTKKLCADKKIEFKLEIQKNAAEFTLYSDKDLIKKLLEKLLDNALKYTKEGSISFGCQISEEKISFFVRDTGSGIDENMMDLIFEMFRQEDSDMTREYEGSGLGLTIALGLSDLLGGKINAVSEKGKGSEFTFSIPTRRLIKDIPNEAKDTKSKNTKKPLILIAEDDELNYGYLEIVLKSYGYNLIHAVNGKEAVDICMQNHEISIVLMDIKMLVMHGDEATRKIRTFRPELPIIATTAYAQTGDEHRFREAGCNDYIPKPIVKERLLDLIKKYVG